MATVLWFAGFILCVAIVVAVRVKSHGKWEIRSSDVVVAVIPLLLGMFFAGKFDDLKIGPECVELKRAIQSALTAPAVASTIKSEVPTEVLGQPGAANAPSPPTSTEAKKRATKFVRDRVQALVFRMGPGHASAAIQVYLDRLLPEPHFRFLIVEDAEQRFIGLFPVDSVRDSMSDQSPGGSGGSFSDRLAATLNSSDVSALKAMPGFIESTIPAGIDNRAALKILNDQNAPFLPVVKDGKFVGIADRTQIIASVLVDISNHLTPP